MTQQSPEDNRPPSRKTEEIKLPSQSSIRLIAWVILIAAGAILTEKALTWIIAHFEAGRNFLKRFDLPTLLSLAGALGVGIRYVVGQISIFISAFERLRQRVSQLEQKVAEAELLRLPSRTESLEREVSDLKAEDSEFKNQCNQNREDILSLGFRHDFLENRLNQVEQEQKKKK
jgi:ABC-type multidrug transport system fused ATPase/permease subunit